jgi:hypothetical protein
MIKVIDSDGSDGTIKTVNILDLILKYVSKVFDIVFVNEPLISIQFLNSSMNKKNYVPGKFDFRINALNTFP